MFRFLAPRPLPTVGPLPAPPRLDSRRASFLFLDDRGAATAEYAIATMANVEVIKQKWSGRHGPSE